ncbi:MAG: hypothetical protein HZA88_09735 [Verrucomicrobia bacterium]|nr:hypothetical protein [Verrucomicrobiota bacterium]
MKKLWTVAGLSLIAAVAMVVSASAAEKDGKAADKPKPHQITGEVCAISADCITLKSKKEGEVKIELTKGTVFGTKAEPKKCDDFKVGDKVVVFYKEGDGKKCAVAVRVPAPKKAPKK